MQSDETYDKQKIANELNKKEALGMPRQSSLVMRVLDANLASGFIQLSSAAARPTETLKSRVLLQIWMFFQSTPRFLKAFLIVEAAVLCRGMT